MQVQTALFFESVEDIYERVYRELRPRSPLPDIRVRYCRFANANSLIRMQAGKIDVRISDLLEGSPAPIAEALAWILLSKMLRKPVPRVYTHRYRLYMNRREVRRSLHLVRQQRGRKFISGPEGTVYNLEVLFEVLNEQYFNGLMARPLLGWSRRPSRTTLGHYDPSHNAIILSRILDSPAVPEVAVRYVLYHEMLHLRFPVEHKGSRRCIHTPEFQATERLFNGLEEAKQALKRL